MGEMGLRTSASKTRVEHHDIAGATAGSPARSRRGWRKRRSRRSTHRGAESAQRVSSELPRGSSVGWRRWFPHGLAILFTLIAATRIVGTYNVFSNTYDEPLHVASGLELLSRGTYTYETRHPPFARVVAALGPYLLGARSLGRANQFNEGDDVLRSGAGYRANLNAARLAVLPFFLLACLALFGWARYVAGDLVAVTAVLLFTLTPPVLGHAASATTDMAAVAGLTTCAFALSRWLDTPVTWRHTAFLGLGAAFALGTKFSSIPFLGLAAVLMLLVRTGRRRARSRVGATGPPFDARGRVVHLAGATAIALLLVWASYGFDVGRVQGIPVPMPQLFRGIRFLAHENAVGHAAYLLGHTYVGGTPLFFPVLLAVKTPIPLLALATVGVGIACLAWWRHGRSAWIDPLLLGASILAVAMASNINLGIRHVLGIYPVLALAGGVSIDAALRSRSRFRTALRLALTGALLWMVAGTWRAHPDYLAWFNEFAGNDPGRIAVDSDLDWGQDLDRLADTVRARGITSLSLAYFGTSSHASAVLPGLRRISRADPAPRTTGWFAISETLYRRGTASFVNDVWTQHPHAYDWLRAYTPVARIGHSIRLYYIPVDSTDARGAVDSAAVSAGVTAPR